MVKKRMSSHKNKGKFTPQPSREWGKEMGLQMPMLELDQDEDMPPPLVLGVGWILILVHWTSSLWKN